MDLLAYLNKNSQFHIGRLKGYSMSNNYKSPQQEISELLLSNHGNRLTNELIAGMQARLFKILEQHTVNHAVSIEENKECHQSK